MLKPAKTIAGMSLLVALMFTASQAAASGRDDYHVTITNLTYSINFTPVLVASHRRPVSIFEPGAPASDDLSAIAEGGDIGPLTTTLNHDDDVVDVQSSVGLLGPGQSVTVVVSGDRGAKYISVASMMLPTNDGFIGLNSMKVSRRGETVFYSPGYDAGSEANDELCVNIPGPTCAGAGPSPGSGNPGDENYVHIHRGTQGIGDLDAGRYDWRNPVARISVTRVQGNKHD